MADLFSRFIVDTSSFVGAINTVTQAVQNLARGATTAAQTMQTSLTQTEAAAQRVASSLSRTVTAATDLARAANQTATALGTYTGAANRATAAANQLNVAQAAAATAAVNAANQTAAAAASLFNFYTAQSQTAAGVAARMTAWYAAMNLPVAAAARNLAAVGTAAGAAVPPLAQHATLMHTLTSASALAVGPLSGVGARVAALNALMTHGNLILGGAIASFAVLAFTSVKLGKAGLEAAISFDRIQRTLTAATGSAEAGSAAYAQVRDVVVRLGLDLESSSLQFAKLAAASKGTALEGAGVQRIFEAVATASAVLGLSSEQTGGALQAIQQMMSKGTVQAEELRGQLGERLPGAFRLAAESMGLTTRELGKLLESGRVISDEFLPKLADVLLTTFGPRAKEASESFQSSLARLGTAFFELGVKIGEFLKDPAQRFIDWLTDTVTIINEAADPGGIPALERHLAKLLDLQKNFRERIRGAKESGAIRYPGQGLEAAIASTEHALEQAYERQLQLATAANKLSFTPRGLSPEEIQARSQALKTELTERLEGLEIEDAKRKFLVASWQLMDRDALTHELAIIQKRRDALAVWFRGARDLAIEAHGDVQAEIDKIAKTPEDQLSDFQKRRREMLPEMLKVQQKEIDELKARYAKMDSDIEKSRIAVLIRGEELTHEEAKSRIDAATKISDAEAAAVRKLMEIREQGHAQVLEFAKREEETIVKINARNAVDATRTEEQRQGARAKTLEHFTNLLKAEREVMKQQAAQAVVDAIRESEKFPDRAWEIQAEGIEKSKRIAAEFRRAETERFADSVHAFEQLGRNQTEVVAEEYNQRLLDLEKMLARAAEMEVTITEDMLTRIAEIRRRALRNKNIAAAAARAASYEDINDEVVANIKADQAIMDHRIGNLRIINTAEEKAATQRAELLQEMSRQTGDIYGFMAAIVQQELLKIGSSWDVLERLIRSTFGSIRSSLADVFEALMDNTKKMSDVWKNFLNRLRRSIAEFLADAVVKQLFGWLLGAFGGAAGGGVGGTAAGAALSAIGGTAGFGGTGISAMGVMGAAASLSSLGAIGTGLGSPYGGYASLAGGLQGLYSASGFQITNPGFLSAGAPGLASPAGVVSGLGVVGGILSIIGAQTGNRKLMAGGQLVSAASLGLVAGTGFAAAAEAGGVAAGAATTSAAAGGGAAGAAAAAAPYAAAAILAALSIYNATQVSGPGNWKYLPEGQRIGTRVGAAIGSLGISELVPEEFSAFVNPITAYIGGLIGSFFGQPDVPHRIREALEAQRTAGQVSGFMGQIATAMTFPALAKILLASQSGYAGGTSPLAIGIGARNVPVGQLLNPQVVGAGGAYANWLTEGTVSAAGIGPASTYYPVISPTTLFQTARTRPQDLYAGVQAGLHESILNNLNAPIPTAIVNQVKIIDALTDAIIKTLDEILVQAIQPAQATTLQARLERSTTTFRELLAGGLADLDARLKTARDWLLGLTDPEEILVQVNTIKDLIKERYQTEIDVVQSFVSELDKAKIAWSNLAQSIGNQITALQESNLGPETNPSFLVGRTKTRFEDAFAAFRASATPENAATLSALAQPYLEAVSAIYTRPSGEYRTIFETVTGALEEARLKAKDTETMFRDAMSDALGGLESVEKLVERNTAQMSIDLANLRIDAANVFQALGFDIPGGSLTDALRQLIEEQQRIVAATIVPVAPPDQLALLSLIVVNTGRTVEALGAQAANAAAAEALRLNLAVPGQQTDQFGRSFVPYDNYVTRLHRGERILTADEARDMDRGGSGVVFEAGAIVINGADSRTSGEIVDEIERRIRFGTLGEAIRRRVTPAGV